MKMTVEKSVLLSLLKCTKAGPVSRQLVIKVSRIPAQTADNELSKFAAMSFFNEYRGVVEASSSQRIKMAIHALRLGADFQHVCSLLSWGEFEGITAQALDANNHEVIRNLNFRHGGRRWQIDVLGIRKPIILCVDCKHWNRGWRNAANLKAVEAQIERTQALAESLPSHSKRINLEDWSVATLLPLVLSLLPGPEKLYNRVPVVPILQLHDFINKVPLEIDLLLHIRRELNYRESKLTDFHKNGS